MDESDDITLTILNIGTRCKSVVSFMSWPLNTWKKSSQYTLDKMDGSQSWSVYSGKDKTITPCWQLN